MINISSAAVYGKPLTPYGASKKWGETVAEVYKDKIEIVTVRPFNIYGVGQNPNYGYVIHNFINGIKEKGEIEIYGDGNQTRDFISVDDVVGSLETLLTSEVPEKPIDLGTGVQTEIIDLANVVGKIVGKKFKIKYQPARKEIMKSVADTSGLKRLGIDSSEFVTIEQGLSKLI